MSKSLTTLEATCLVAGAGIGGGVMAVPYLAQQVGLLWTVVIAGAAYLVTLTLHLMVAELSVRTDYSSELLTVFSKHLFRNKKPLKVAFYVLMAVTLVCNLAAYITGAGEILSELAGFGPFLGKLLFFVLAAVVVFLGLKKVALNEAVSMALKLGFLAVMAAMTFMAAGSAEPLAAGGPLLGLRLGLMPVLAVYGLVMFSLSSLFAVPQAASGLRHSRSKLVRSVVLGLLLNLAVIVVVTACVLYSSSPVTEVAIVGWAQELGPVINVLGSLFVFLAMLGAFWSISLQLCDMTGAFFKVGHRLSWLAGTLPCFVVALLPMAGFLDLMQIAGGATAVIVALMVVPAYLGATRQASKGETLLGGIGKSRTVAIAVMLMYILMAVASFL